MRQPTGGFGIWGGCCQSHHFASSTAKVNFFVVKNSYKKCTAPYPINHTCNDPKGLYYAIEAMHQAILGFPPDQFTHYERGVSWDYGLPNPSCIVQFDWAPHLEHGNINYAMLAFTIPATSPHSGATVAALLRQAHSWGPRGESPYYHMTDSRNTPYRMTLSCLKMSQWVNNESRSRADRHQQAVRQMLRLQSRGRVHVNILPAYGPMGPHI